MKILIVDDERSIRNSLKETIEDEGYEVDVAEDGLKALSMVEKERYAVIFCDIKMPGMDGIEVLDKLMEQDGILQNSILSDEQFLGKRITYSKRNLSPVIVGICDSGQPAIYAHSELFASVGVTGSEVASLSTLKARYPGVYDHITLAEGECLVVPAKAGITYEHKLGSHFTTLSGKSFRIIMNE